MKSSNKVAFFLLNCFISRGIFAQLTENRNDGVETANKPNHTEKLSIAKCCPEKQLIQKINVVKIISTPCPKTQLTSDPNATIPSNQTSSCRDGQLLEKITIKENGCGDYDKKLLSFTEFPVFNKFFHETDKKINEHFNLVGPEVMNITNFSKTKVMNPNRYHMYIMEDSTLVIEKPNQVPWARWNKYDKSLYCIDYFKWTKTGKITPHYFLIQVNVEPPVIDYYRFPVMLVSCVFLSLVLVVYCLLPELRNLRGRILMSYVASLLVGFAFFAAMNIISNLRKSSTGICKTFTFVIYFFMLSSFFWTNVMSLDIWWTFRGFANIRLIHRRGEWFKYLVYCFYAWGMPFLMAAALIVMNETDMRHLPWFVTPQITNEGCFISDGPRLLYLYVPMMLVWAVNCVLFVMTSLKMWRLSRGHEVLTRAAAAAGTPGAHISARNRLIVYLKLSALMGITWILEVVSSVRPKWPIWIITNVYNLVIGVVIFFIFVCKRKIWHMLLKRYSRHPWTGRTRWFLNYNATKELPTLMSDSEVILETQHTVSYSTRGDGADKK